jgi:DNA-binding protein H-NS
MSADSTELHLETRTLLDGIRASIAALIKPAL